MSDYSYPDEFIKKAEARIRKQVDGNGVNPKLIGLSTKRQGKEIVMAESWFESDIAINQSTTKGRSVKGQVIESGQSKQEIEQFIEDYQNGNSFVELAKEKIRSLPLMGFGAKDEIIPLKKQGTIFTEHVPCQTCGGQAKARCNTCQGRGRTQCVLCHARGFIRCLYCQGNGQIQNGDSMKPCVNCQGKGEIFCTQCHGQKEVPCTACQSRGEVSCHDCQAQGVNSIHYTVEPLLKISSAIHIQELEQEPKTLVSKVGALTLAKGGHIDVKETKPPEDEETEKPSEMSYYQDDNDLNENTKNKIYYQANVPWAVAGVEVDGKPYNISFVGKKGAVADSGHFMDDVMDTAATQLSQAAKGDGFVAGLIKEACNIRVSRETLAMLIKGSRKKTLMELSKNYRIGMTKNFSKSFVQNAYLALKRVTRRPRYIGLGIGLALACALYYYWFIGNGRGMSVAHPQNPRLIMDAIPLGIGFSLTLLLTKGAGFLAYQSVMKDIGIKSYKLPMAGKAALYGLIGNLMLWGGFLGFMIFK